MLDALTVLINTAQNRVATPRITATVAGTEWQSEYTSPDIWIAPVVDTVCLRPNCLYFNWHLYGTGFYARRGLSSWNLPGASSDWKTHEVKSGTGPVRIYNPAGMSAPAYSTTPNRRNAGMFVSFYCFNVGNDAPRAYFHCGWSDTHGYTAGRSVLFWANGKVDVYSDNVLVGSYTLGNKAGSQSTNYADYILLPMRRRELYVYCITSGDAFVHVFEDIAEDEEEPIITAEEDFWWYVPSEGTTATVDVEIADLQFIQTATAVSQPIRLARNTDGWTPFNEWTNEGAATGIANARVFADKSFRGTGTEPVVSDVHLVKADNSGDFVGGTAADDTLCRMSLTITADDLLYTPFVYWAHVAQVAEVVQTDDSEQFDITPYIVGEATLDVPDDPGGVSFRCSLQLPETLDATYVAKLLTVTNRPALVKIGEVVLLDGVTMPGEFVDELTDETRRFSLEIRDRMHTMQSAQIRERLPLSGFDLCKPSGTSAVGLLYSLVAYEPEECDLDDVDYRIDQVVSQSATDIPYLIDVGAKPYEELDQLVSRYATGFFWGVWPQSSGMPKPVFRDSAGLSDTADATLYRSEADAVTAGVSPDKVFYTFKRTPLEVEANEVWATGFDPRRQLAVRSFAVDAAAQDPAVAPSDQADNWSGEPRIMGVIDPRLTSQAACDKVVSTVFPVVSARYFVGELTSDMLWKSDGAPVWRGSKIECAGRMASRVAAMSIRFILENSEGVVREATYTLGPALSAGGRNASEIRAVQGRRIMRNILDQSRGISQLARRGPV
jgi:hypothetical protein